jgi:hypothetical protein
MFVQQVRLMLFLVGLIVIARSKLVLLDLDVLKLFLEIANKKEVDQNTAEERGKRQFRWTSWSPGGPSTSSARKHFKLG